MAVYDLDRSLCTICVTYPTCSQCKLGPGHVSIVRPRELLLTPRHLAFCMEYVGGGTLQDLVEGKPLSEVGAAEEVEGSGKAAELHCSIWAMEGMLGPMYIHCNSCVVALGMWVL